MHIHSPYWLSFTFYFFYKESLLFLFFIYIYFLLFCQSQRIFPPLSSHAFCLLFCDFTWESIDDIKRHAIEVPACWTCMVFLFSFISSPFFMRLKWTSSGKRTSAQHGVHTFLLFPDHFFGVRTKKVKGASCHHPAHEKVDPCSFHTVNSLLRANGKQCCRGENKDLVSKRNSPSGT